MSCSVQVRVLRPDGKGGRVEAVVLGRGQFVGERAVINDRLRSADCVAQGTVQVSLLSESAGYRAISPAHSC
jgi:cGMP-dependent protein kinase